MKYNLTKIKDKIYLLNFKEHYHLCMFFLRYQEFYESPNKKIRNSKFTLLEFMEWYAKDRHPENWYFSYPLEWSGFNIPSRIIDEVHKLGISDRNKYDDEIMRLHRILRKEAGSDYYLIGASTDVSKEDDSNEITINHEVAHGMYFTIPEYKAEMDTLVKGLPNFTRLHVNAWLKEIGYTKEVFVDETQAYMATGFPSSKKYALRVGWKRASKPFVKVYNKYR